jgi:sporadic carbohydrate cluster protein (TIGR04323 family)
LKTLFTYTLPRPFFGYNIPIAIQSSFIRDYANKNKLLFSLPSTEITKDNCYSIFINLITSKKLKIENIGVVSGYVFPIDNSKFLKDIFLNYNNNKKLKIHLALENMVLEPKDFLDWSESIISLHKLTNSYNNIDLDK